MLFHPWNMFYTFTLALFVVFVQSPMRLCFAIPQFRAFLVCYSGIVRVILKWFQSPLLLLVSLLFSHSTWAEFKFIIIIIIIIIIIHTDTINDLGYNWIQNFISTHRSDSYFLTNRKDVGLYTHYTLFLFYSWELTNTVLNLVRPKHEYASTVWNSIPSTDAKKLTRIQWKFIALCNFPFFTYDHVTYKNFLKFLKLRTLHNGRLLWCTIFIPFYSGLKLCPSLLDTTGIRF